MAEARTSVDSTESTSSDYGHSLEIPELLHNVKNARRFAIDIGKLTIPNCVIYLQGGIFLSVRMNIFLLSSSQALGRYFRRFKFQLF